MKSLKDLIFLDSASREEKLLPCLYQMQLYGKFAKRFGLDPEQELVNILMKNNEAEDYIEQYWTAYKSSEQRIRFGWKLPTPPNDNALPAVFSTGEGQVYLEWLDRETHAVVEGIPIPWPWNEGFAPILGDWNFLDFYVVQEAKRTSQQQSQEINKPLLKVIKGGLSE